MVTVAFSKSMSVHFKPRASDSLAPVVNRKANKQACLLGTASNRERDKSVPYIEVVLAYSRLANVEMNQIVDDDLELNL